ncbi:MAG: 2-oxoglutarate dehydrogenase complex dihydrolipoyllysine-residue succinyltransferase [Flavobacteriales bacterium]
MRLEMKVPSPGESISEVEIATWLVKDGDYVERDQAIAELDSDKATLELPAEASGIITHKAAAGDTVAVGQVVCSIDTDAKKDSAAAPKAEKEANPSQPEPTRAESYASGTPAPAAKKILDEAHIDPTRISGTGKAGRITKADAIEAKHAMGTPGLGNRSSSRKKFSALRRKLSRRLVAVKNQTAMLTTFNEIDMGAVFDLRSRYKSAFKEKHGVSLGFMSFFTKAIVKALREFPEVNSMIDGDYQEIFDYCDISIAVSGPKGLMVPVVRNAENLSFRGIETAIKNLAIKVQAGTITVDDMTGGTFTISNGGVFGSMLSTPILNPPQSAILGMHNIVARPVAIDGQVAIRPVMYVALSYDHRVIDGRESVGFLIAIKKAIEDPIEELMGGADKIEGALEL